MAITTTERFESRGGSEDDQGIITLKRGWVVETEDDLTGEIEAWAACGVEKYAPHPNYAVAIARKITASPLGTARQWLVEIEYSNAPFPAPTNSLAAPIDPGSPTMPDKANNQSASAETRPNTFRFKRKETSEYPEQDLEETPVMNTAGDRMTLEVKRSLLGIEVEYYSLELTVAHIIAHWDTINDAEYQGFPARSLRVVDFGYESVYETLKVGTQDYLALLFKVKVELEYKKGRYLGAGEYAGHEYRVLNAGLRCKDGSGNLVACVDATGQPVTEPVPLAADGTQLPAGSPYHYLTFKFYEERDFEELFL